DENWFAPAEAIRNESKQRTANDPSEGNCGRAHHGCAVFEAVRILQKAHSPNHVKDGCGNEHEPRNQAAQNRLRIPEYYAEADSRTFQPTAGLFLWFFFGNQEEQ